MEADELRRLRARAYGPDADIASDPAALARLEELEAARRAPEPEHVAPAASASASAAASIEQTAPAESSDANRTLDDIPPVDGAPVPSAPPRGWRGWSRRRATVVGAVVLVLAVVVAVGATTFVIRRSGYVAPVEAVLAESPGREVPSIFGMPTDDSRVFADFAGFTPIASERGWNGPMNGDCLMLVESEFIDDATANSFGGMVLYGCGAGPFDANISLLVGSSVPQALRDRYPEGTAVQFVLEGDEVVVLTSPPDDVPTESPAR